MCLTCYEEYGSPKINNPLVRELSAAIDEIYEFSGVGSGLHIVLDDWNLEDSHVLFCRDWCESHLDNDDELAACRKCADLLLRATIEERASALIRTKEHRDWWEASQHYQ